MKYRLSYLLTGIFILLTFVQCKNSISETDTKSYLDKKIELIAPEVDSGQSTSPTFKWKKVEGVQTFQIQLSMDEDFATTNIDSIIDTTSLGIQNLHHDTTFHWKVRAIGAEREGPWSDSWNFKTKVKPSESEDDTLAGPDQISPEDGVSSTSLQTTFEWKAVDGADFYILHVSYTDQMVVDEQLKGTTYTPTDELIPEGTHYWRVRAVKDGNKGKWSGIKKFKTAEKIDTLRAPSLISPEHEANSTSLKPTFEWEPVDGADYYILHASHTDQMVVDEQVKKTTYTPDEELSPEAIHYWRVRAVKDKGKGKGDWSEIEKFTTTSNFNISKGSEGTSDSDDPSGDISDDREALMDLYKATDGDQWDNNSGWGDGDPSNSWYGIEVDAGGRVVQLNLQNNNLSGSLPESIGNLTKVQYFNVKQNSLVSEIPSTIGKMERLTHLLLNGRNIDMNTEDPHHPGKPSGTTADQRSNNFYGEIPSEIGNLSNLKWIEINGTGNTGEGLTGAVPDSFGNLSNLLGLHLDFNQLTRFPASLGNLTNLIHLALGHQGSKENKILEGRGFPQWIGKLVNLKFLWFERNYSIGGTLPDMSRLTDLEIILVDFARLTGTIPSYFTDGTMPNINMIQLAWNNFSGSLPEIHEPNNLAAFTVEGSDLTGPIPDSWGTDAAKQMINFGVGWNELEGEIPDLSQMYRLRYFRGNNNNFTGTIPGFDTTNKKLQFIHVSNNLMSGRISKELADLANLPKFRELDISNNRFSDDDIQPLLEALNTDGNINSMNY